MSAHHDSSTSVESVGTARVNAHFSPPASVCMHVLNPLRADARVRRMASTLASSGINVTVVDVEEGRWRPKGETVGDVVVKHIRLPSRFSPYYHSNTSFVPWILFKMLRILLGIWVVVRTRADVYHAVDLTALPACYLAAIGRRKPLVFEAHELPLTEPSVTDRRLLWASSTWLCRAMVARCTAVITVSPPIVEEIHRRFGGPEATIVRNIPLYQAVEPSDILRSHLGLSQLTRLALFQGNLQSDRSLDILIRAARYLDEDIIMVLLGNGESQAELEALKDNEGVRDRVRFVPAVPYAELLDWTTSADIGLIVYRPELSANVEMCLPNKLFEYLMAGLPVLASQLPAVAQILTTYDCGHVVSSLGPQTVAGAINDLIADKEGRARMRQNALAACERELRWDVERHKLIQVYEDTLKTTLSYE